MKIRNQMIDWQMSAINSRRNGCRTRSKGVEASVSINRINRRHNVDTCSRTAHTYTEHLNQESKSR